MSVAVAVARELAVCAACFRAPGHVRARADIPGNASATSLARKSEE